MPCIGDISVDINNGETLLSIEKCLLKFKYKTAIIEQELTTSQSYLFIDIISQKAKEKCEEINNKIAVNLEKIIK